MTKKILSGKIATALFFVFLISSTAIATEDIEMRKVFLSARGILTASDDAMNVQSSRIIAAEFSHPLQEEMLIDHGLFFFGNQKYSLKEITGGIDAFYADIFQGKENIGTISLTPIDTEDALVWAGTVFLRERQYNAYYMQFKMRAEETQRVRDQAKNMKEFCKNNPDEKECAFRNECETNPESEECQALLKRVCQQNLNDIRCRQFLRENCEKDPTQEFCIVKERTVGEELRAIHTVRASETITNLDECTQCRIRCREKCVAEFQEREAEELRECLVKCVEECNACKPVTRPVEPIVCPMIERPGPDFCPEGRIIPVYERGCVVGFNCVETGKCEAPFECLTREEIAKRNCRIITALECPQREIIAAGAGESRIRGYTADQLFCAKCPDIEDCICPRIYAPVCGVDGKTYGNACMAECRGIRIAYEGECKEVKLCQAPYKCLTREQIQKNNCSIVPGYECPQLLKIDLVRETKVIRSKAININHSDFFERKEGDTISIELFDRERKRCVIDSIREIHAIDTKKMRCRIGDHGHAIFSLSENKMLTTIYDDTGKNYQIRLSNAGEYILEEIEFKEPILPEKRYCARCPDTVEPTKPCPVQREGYYCMAPEKARENNCRILEEYYCPTYPDPQLRKPEQPIEPEYIEYPYPQPIRTEVCAFCPVKECICPAVWEPVCGTDGRTYSNACMAECRGIRIAHKGECALEEFCRKPYECISLEEIREKNCIKVEGQCPQPDVYCPPDEDCSEHQFACAFCPGDNILDTKCGLDTKCPEGYSCYDFPEIGLRCAKTNPCEYYECPRGKECMVLEIYPGRVICQEIKSIRPCEYPGQCMTKEAIHENNCTILEIFDCPTLIQDCELGQPCPSPKPMYCARCPDTEDCICPTVWEPVCGVNGKTYSNTCYAECADVEIAHKGECREKECVGEGEKGYFDQECCEGLTRIQNIKPVRDSCPPATPDGSFLCTKCGDGECGKGENWCNCPQDCPAPEEDCICPTLWEPVCGVNGKTYSNTCYAECADVEIAHKGECRETSSVSRGSGGD